MGTVLVNPADINAYRSELSERYDNVVRDQEFADWMEFVSTCFDFSKNHPEFAVIAGEEPVIATAVGKVMATAQPILAAIGDKLDEQARELADWNIKTAGKNEMIAGDIRRNWQELEKLGWNRAID